MSGIAANQLGSQISNGRRKGASKKEKGSGHNQSLFLLKYFDD
jgi:hypothetical protein